VQAELLTEWGVRLGRLAPNPLPHQWHRTGHVIVRTDHCHTGVGGHPRPKRTSMTHHCPTCQRVLYNRRLTKCGYCGEPIPAAVRFTPEESAVLKQKLADLEAQQRQRQQAADQAADEARRRAAEGPISFFPGFPLDRKKGSRLNS